MKTATDTYSLHSTKVQQFRSMLQMSRKTTKLIILTAVYILVVVITVNALSQDSTSVKLGVSPSSERYLPFAVHKGGTTVLAGRLRQKSKGALHIAKRYSCTTIVQTAQTTLDELQDCFDLGDANWFGGGEQFLQYWPLEHSQFSDYSYLSKRLNNQAIAEPYWLSSKGVYIHVADGTPLFIDLNNKAMHTLCLSAQSKPPYQPAAVPVLNYTVCSFDDARKAHEHAIKTVLGKPSGYPDERMIRDPIWSTWARYKSSVDEKTVLTFAREIVANGFSNSQLEIDDKWEGCYGSLNFSESKFPNPKNLTDTLKAMGFRVTLWIHPFINVDCEPMYSEALEKGYFVKNLAGSVKTKWWNGAAGIIDFTNTEAADWFVSRLKLLQEDAGIDSFKFDAGETNYLPQLPVLNSTVALNPSAYATRYVEMASKFGSMVEVRVGQRTQNLPIFVRMRDKYSKWGWNNGIKTLVTTLLQMNMVGYPLVLPDMIGGNGYGVVPSKELFIRWLQANVFMPSLQYSYVPWDFDDETVTICKKFTDLHAQYADKIIELAQKATVDGSPLNPPIWWVAPTDEIALESSSEFLLGEDILVAPVLDEGATSRDIYLPQGQWRDELRAKTLTGPLTLTDYQVALDELAYFTRVSD